MATEYYIVKPKTKQTFYLGKRISCLDGLSTWSHVQKPRFPEWECWEDVVTDFNENNKYFLQGWPDLTVGQVWDFCYKIYDFCNDAVYLDNDCSDNFSVWRDWEVIDCTEDLISPEYKWLELINLIPEQYWIKVNKDDTIVVDKFLTIKNILEYNFKKEIKNEAWLDSDF